MKNMRLLLVPLVVMLVAALATDASAMLTFENAPDVTFAEDATSNTLDLDAYVTDSGVAPAKTDPVTFTYAITNLPGGAACAAPCPLHVAIDATTHVVTFSADANWNGQKTVTFTAADSTAAPNQQIKTDDVVVTVTNVNDAPVLTAQASTAQLKEGQPFTLAVAASDVDAGDTKIFSATPTVAWPSFAINAQTGQISFTPTAADTGAHLVDITVTDAAGATDTETFRFYVAELCTSTAISFANVDVTDTTGDDDELLPGDFLEAEFDAKNTLQEDLSDVKVSAWIENLGDGERFSSKVDSKKQDIDSRDSKSLLLKLRLDLDAARTDGIKSTQVLYIRAEGDDRNGTAQCAVYQKDLAVERISDDLLIDAVTFSPEEPVCGGSVSISAQIFDIGRSSPDDVKLRFKNSALSLDKTTSSFEMKTGGRDAKATKTVDFEIPSTVKAGDYPIEVIASFNDGEDTESLTSNLKIGACEAPTLTAATGAAATASASTSTIAVSQSTAVAKREEIVKYTITLTNTQATAAAYQFDLTGIADWATGSVEPQDITLGAGASMPVYVYLTPKDDAKGGEHTATLTVKSGATVVDSKTLTTNVQAPTTTVTEFSNKKISMPSLNFGSVNRDSALFVVLFVVVLVFAGFLYARDKGRKASKVEVIRE